MNAQTVKTLKPSATHKFCSGDFTPDENIIKKGKIILIIKTLFNAVVIPNGDFAIYTNEYPADGRGNPLEEDDPRIEEWDFYEFGDLIIETANKKYVFKTINRAQKVVEELIDKISEMKNANEVLVIDIGALGGRDAEDPDTFELEVLEK